MSTCKIDPSKMLQTQPSKLGKLLSPEERQAKQQERQRRLAASQRKRDHVSQVGSALSLVAALVGGGVLQVLLSPDWAEYGAEIALANSSSCAEGACTLATIGYCHDAGSCSKWRIIFGITAGLSFTLTMMTLMMAIAVALGFPQWLSWSIPTFTLSLQLLAIALTASFFMTYEASVVIPFTVFMGIFLLCSMIALFPAFTLAWYSIKGKHSLLKLLQRTEKGTLEVREVPGTSAIHFAAYGNKFWRAVLLKVIIAEGEDPDRAAPDGHTPLMFAACSGNLGGVKTLLEAGADPNAVNGKGTTALHRASFNGGIEIADYLLQYQAYVSLQDQEGWTPLHLASVRGFLPLVKLLVEAGADVEAADLRGRAPIHAASIKGHCNVVKMLIDAGASPNIQDDRGTTPLQLAFITGNVPMAELLLSKGADPWTNDIKGRTAQDYALDAPDWEEIVEGLPRYFRQGGTTGSRMAVAGLLRKHGQLSRGVSLNIVGSPNSSLGDGSVKVGSCDDHGDGNNGDVFIDVVE